MIQLCCHRIMHIHLRALLWSPPRAPFKYRFVAHVNWTWFSIRFYALSVGSQGQTEVKTSASLATDNNKPSYYNVLAAAANQRLHETWQAIQGFLLLACWHFADCSYASSSSVRFLKEQGKKRKEPKFTGWPFLFYFSLLYHCCWWALFFCLYSHFDFLTSSKKLRRFVRVSCIERPWSVGEWMNGKSYLVGGNGCTSHFTSAQLFNVEAIELTATRKQ